jgi:adenylate cyclase
MFTDMVGYTALSQKDESFALQVVSSVKSLLDPIVEMHGGRFAKTMGDGFLVEFPSAMDAVLCAIEIQHALFETPSSTRSGVQIRIGIHTGDVIHEKGDVLGDAVNIASRIEPLAGPGEICISSEVMNQVKNRLNYALIPMGAQRLKNVTNAVDTYKVLLPWTVPTTSSTKEDSTPKHRLAVLPLSSFSPDPNDDYFADGLTEELIATISNIVGVEVISRTSVMQYKANPKPLKEVAKELGVANVVEGSVRKAGNKLRITIQMIDASNDRHLWVERYDRELQDVFAIQSEIGTKVAEALQARFSGGEREASEQTEDLEAYTLYLRATQLYHQGGESSERSAVATFERAIARDGSYAKAYAGLAHAWAEMRFSSHMEYTEVIEKAEEAARKAIALSPDLAEAHYALAKVNAHLDRWVESISEAEKAIGINPNLSDGNFVLGWIYLSLGRNEKSLEFFRRAYGLDPLNPVVGVWMSTVLSIMGKFSESEDVLNRLREFNPNSSEVCRGLAECYMLEGEFTKAEEMLNVGTQISPDEPRIAIDKGVLYALTGRRKEAEDALEDFIQKSSMSIGNYAGVFIQAALGNQNEAFEALMAAAETHASPIQVKSHPLFAEMRKDHRFSQWETKVGLPT